MNCKKCNHKMKHKFNIPLSIAHIILIIVLMILVSPFFIFMLPGLITINHRTVCEVCGHRDSILNSTNKKRKRRSSHSHDDWDDDDDDWGSDDSDD